MSPSVITVHFLSFNNPLVAEDRNIYIIAKICSLEKQGIIKIYIPMSAASMGR